MRPVLSLPSSPAWSPDYARPAISLRRTACRTRRTALVVHGGTIGPLVRLITPKVDQAAIDAQTNAERTRIKELLRSSAGTIPEPPNPETTPEGFAAAKSHR